LHSQQELDKSIIKSKAKMQGSLNDQQSLQSTSTSKEKKKKKKKKKKKNSELHLPDKEQ